MHLRCSLAAAAVVLALSSSTARADEEWYGYQVLATDVGGWALIAGGLKAGYWETAACGAGVLAVGGPVVHTAHHNLGRAGISLGMRVGAPVAGFILGELDQGERSSSNRPFIGVMIGYVAAAIVDIAVVAREPRGEGPSPAPRVLSLGGRF